MRVNPWFHVKFHTRATAIGRHSTVLSFYLQVWFHHKMKYFKEFKNALVFILKWEHV